MKTLLTAPLIRLVDELNIAYLKNQKLKNNIMIELKITGESADEIRNQLSILIGESKVEPAFMSLPGEPGRYAPTNTEQLGKKIEKPKTRSRATAQPAEQPPAPIETPAPPVDEWETPPANGTEEVITVDKLRAKIAKVPQELKQKVRDLIASFTKADGTPCVTGPDIQEKDYPAIYQAIDLIGK